MNLTPITYKICNDPVLNGGLIDIDGKWPDSGSPQIITVESRSSDHSTWTISNGWGCFSKSRLRFDREASPSNREKDFIQDTRFSSPEEALEFWKNNWIYYAYYPKPIFRWKSNYALREKLTEEDERIIEKVREYLSQRNLLDFG